MLAVLAGFDPTAMHSVQPLANVDRLEQKLAETQLVALSTEQRGGGVRGAWALVHEDLSLTVVSGDLVWSLPAGAPLPESLGELALLPDQRLTVAALQALVARVPWRVTLSLAHVSAPKARAPRLAALGSALELVWSPFLAPGAELSAWPDAHVQDLRALPSEASVASLTPGQPLLTERAQRPPLTRKPIAHEQVVRSPTWLLFREARWVW